MNLVFFGPPGAGKGTMATRLAESRGLPHISAGDIFRANIAEQTELGKQVKSILDSGNLVPDEITIAIIRDRLMNEEKGYILDGYPRTIPQAKGLEQYSTVDCALYFTLEEKEILRRLGGRRIHKQSGRTYHVEFKPPKVEGKDDLTGDPLITRPDDTEDAIRNRLEVYIRETTPLIEFYRERDVLVTLDASPLPDEVYTSLEAILNWKE